MIHSDARFVAVVCLLAGTRILSANSSNPSNARMLDCPIPFILRLLSCGSLALVRWNYTILTELSLCNPSSRHYFRAMVFGFLSCLLAISLIIIRNGEGFNDIDQEGTDRHRMK
jgi:hypothetical protein